MKRLVLTTLITLIAVLHAAAAFNLTASRVTIEDMTVDKPNYFDKICAALLAVLAGSQLLAGKDEEARGTLIRAKELAAFFDASPNYDETDIRFVTRIEGTSAHDDLGTTAMDGVCKAIGQFENEELTALWKSLTEQEDHHE